MGAMILGTIATGTVAGWATFAILAVGALIFWRGGGGTAIQSLESANRVLEKEKARLEGENRELVQANAHLRSQTDVALVMQPILDWTIQHERHAQERHSQQLAEHRKQLTVLDLIANR